MPTRGYNSGIPCDCPGCDKPAKGYLRYCGTHNNRAYDFGHPDQLPLTVAHLRPWMKKLDRWFKNTTEGRKSLAAVSEHYRKLAEAAVVEHRLDLAEVERTGIIHRSGRYFTAEVVAKVWETKDPYQTILQLLAYGMIMREVPQGYFRSDLAEILCVTHVFIGQSQALQRVKFYPSSGKLIASRRHVNRRHREALGRWLLDNLAGLGVHISRRWNEVAGQEKRDREALIKAVTGQG